MNVCILSILLKNRNYFLKGLTKSQNAVLQICNALFTYSQEFVQLCCKYNLDVALCCSGVIFAAVCSDFRHVIFSHL